MSLVLAPKPPKGHLALSPTAIIRPKSKNRSVSVFCMLLPIAARWRVSIGTGPKRRSIWMGIRFSPLSRHFQTIKGALRLRDFQRAVDMCADTNMRTCDPDIFHFARTLASKVRICVPGISKCYLYRCAYLDMRQNIRPNLAQIG